MYAENRGKMEERKRERGKKQKKERRRFMYKCGKEQCFCYRPYLSTSGNFHVMIANNIFFKENFLEKFYKCIFTRGNLHENCPCYLMNSIVNIILNTKINNSCVKYK